MLACLCVCCWVLNRARASSNQSQGACLSTQLEGVACSGHESMDSQTIGRTAPAQPTTRAETASTMDAGETPDRIGDFDVHGVLGSGSFGEVYLGIHKSSRQKVAIKALAKRGKGDATSENSVISRISSEVSTMEKIGGGCPFIVRLYEVLLSQRVIYLVVEYAARGELFKCCFKPLDDVTTDVGHPAREQRARHYFQQLVIGLDWCHQQGVAHRDVKPQNLLVSASGVLKIADFGLAASFNPDPSMKLPSRSLRQTMCGSPLYMAPEMLHLQPGRQYNSIATDAWGCGAVLYAMMFGCPPFPAATFAELIVLAAKPQLNLRLPDNLSGALSGLIRCLLNADPNERYTLPQVAQDEWFQNGLQKTLSERAPGFVPPACMQPMKKRSRPGVGCAGQKKRVLGERVVGHHTVVSMLRALSMKKRKRAARVRPLESVVAGRPDRDD